MCLILIALASYSNASDYPNKWFGSDYINLASEIQNVKYLMKFNSSAIYFIVRDLIFNSIIPFKSINDQNNNKKQIFYGDVERINFTSWRGFVNIHIYPNNVNAKPIICYGLEIKQKLLGAIISALEENQSKIELGK
jgi:hypothetical protein